MPLVSFGARPPRLFFLLVVTLWFALAYTGVRLAFDLYLFADAPLLLGLMPAAALLMLAAGKFWPTRILVGVDVDPDGIVLRRWLGPAIRWRWSEVSSASLWFRPWAPLALALSLWPTPERADRQIAFDDVAEVRLGRGWRRVRVVGVPVALWDALRPHLPAGARIRDDRPAGSRGRIAWEGGEGDEDAFLAAVAAGAQGAITGADGVTVDLRDVADPRVIRRRDVVAQIGARRSVDVFAFALVIAIAALSFAAWGRFWWGWAAQLALAASAGAGNALVDRGVAAVGALGLRAGVGRSALGPGRNAVGALLGVAWVVANVAGFGSVPWAPAEVRSCGTWDTTEAVRLLDTYPGFAARQLAYPEWVRLPGQKNTMVKQKPADDLTDRALDRWPRDPILLIEAANSDSRGSRGVPLAPLLTRPAWGLVTGRSLELFRTHPSFSMQLYFWRKDHAETDADEALQRAIAGGPDVGAARVWWFAERDFDGWLDLFPGRAQEAFDAVRWVKDSDPEFRVQEADTAKRRGLSLGPLQAPAPRTRVFRSKAGAPP